MKTNSLLIAALVVLSASVSALGKEVPGKAGLAVVAVKGTEVFKVIYKGETSGKVKLKVYNVKGATIFTEDLEKIDGFILPLNFNGVQYGEYTIELADATGVQIQKISHFQAESSVKDIRISRVANEKSKFVLAVANEGDQLINVKIYDAQNNVVHDETNVVNGNFAQVYSLQSLVGDVTFVVSDKSGNSRTIKY